MSLGLLLNAKNKVMLGRNRTNQPRKWTPFTGIESGAELPIHCCCEELVVVHLFERSNPRRGRFTTDVGIIDWNNEYVARSQAMLLQIKRLCHPLLHVILKTPVPL